jgi:hypothetical protein
MTTWSSRNTASRETPSHPLPGTPNVEVVYDTASGITTRAARGGSLIEGLRLSTLNQDGHDGLYSSDHQSVIPFVYGESVVLLCVSRYSRLS